MGRDIYNLRGSIAERMFQKEFMAEGWAVIRLHYAETNLDVGRTYRYFNKETISKAIDEIFPKDRGESLKFRLLLDLERLKMDKYSLPDFICLQRNRIAFFEVKGYTDKPIPNSRIKQYKTVQELKRLGYKAYIKQYKIDMEKLSEEQKEMVSELKKKREEYKNAVEERQEEMISEFDRKIEEHKKAVEERQGGVDTPSKTVEKDPEEKGIRRIIRMVLRWFK